MKKSLVILAAATMTIGLSACGSMNKIDRQGNIVNKEVKWGNPKYSTFKTSGTMHGGVQSVETLKLVHAGQTKAQIFYTSYNIIMYSPINLKRYLSYIPTNM